MSNDSLSEPGQAAVDHGSNGAAPDVDDEGPLDPSVFFGLFDDLVDDAEIDPESEPEPELDAVPAASLDTDDEPSETDTEPEPEAGPETDALNETEADLDPAGESSAVETGQAGDEEEADTTTAGVQWWSTQPDHLPTNGQAMVIASPPLIPAGAGRKDETNGSEAIDPDVTADIFSDAPAAIPVAADAAEQILDPIAPPDESEVGGGTLAKAVLATITIGLFTGFVVALVFSLRTPDPAVDDSPAGGIELQEPAASSIVDGPPVDLAGAIAAGVPPTEDFLAEQLTSTLPVALANRADLTSIRFEPGTTELDERSGALVAELGALLAEQSTTPVTASVRTYTESTAAANLALSKDQAEAIASALMTAGANPDQVRARGLGATPLSQAQPVPNFVALTPEFGDRRFDEILAQQSPFAFGVPTTVYDDIWPLRSDGLATVEGIAETLAGAPDAILGAAGYSFFPPSESGIRAEADAAAAELTDFLVTAYGVAPYQVRTVTPGSAVFVPAPEHGSHVWIQAGPASRGAFDVAAIDPTDITFDSGSDELDAAGSATVEALAEILTAGGATIVVDLRAYDGADDAANLALSESRRDALAQALITAGVSPPQLRMYASGASSYFRDDQGSAITITVAP